MNTPNSQVYIKIPRKDSVNSLLNRYLDLNYEVLNAATNNRYVDGNDIRLVYLCPIALFGNYKLTTSSRKHLEKIDHAHIVSLMYKLITSSRGFDDSSIGFDRDRNRRQRELTNNKTQKRKYHVRIFLKDVFGLAEYQKKRYIWTRLQINFDKKYRQRCFEQRYLEVSSLNRLIQSQ